MSCQTLLPPEIVAHIFDVTVHDSASDPAMLARLCLVNRGVRQKARARLYSQVRLGRSRIKTFIRSIAGDTQRPIFSDERRLFEVVKDVAFISSAGPDTLTAEADPTRYQHEHVELFDVLQCLSLVCHSVEGICIDMACSQVACGWYEDPVIPDQQLQTLSLPNLARLSCRCPQGYMPTCTRKLLDLFHLGHSPNLEELLLFWTGPGCTFDAPDNAESLTKTLQACPNVCRLSIVEARYDVPTDESQAARTSILLTDHEKTYPNGPTHNEQWASQDIGNSRELWIKSTSAGGAVFRASAASSRTTNECTTEAKKNESLAPYDASLQGVSASQARRDSDAAPTAIGESIARAARRIDQRKNTLRAQLATINVPASIKSIQVAHETTVVEVKGNTHKHIGLSADASEPTSRTSNDDGWSALISLVQGRSRPARPAVP